jgi:hypothetical protein
MLYSLRFALPEEKVPKIKNDQPVIWIAMGTERQSLTAGVSLIGVLLASGYLLYFVSRGLPF